MENREQYYSILGKHKFLTLQTRGAAYILPFMTILLNYLQKMIPYLASLLVIFFVHLLYFMTGRYHIIFLFNHSFIFSTYIITILSRFFDFGA